MLPAICCIRRSWRSFSVSANFTTKLEEAPCRKIKLQIKPCRFRNETCWHEKFKKQIMPFLVEAPKLFFLKNSDYIPHWIEVSLWLNFWWRRRKLQVSISPKIMIMLRNSYLSSVGTFRGGGRLICFKELQLSIPNTRFLLWSCRTYCIFFSMHWCIFGGGAESFFNRFQKLCYILKFVLFIKHKYLHLRPLSFRCYWYFWWRRLIVLIVTK